MTGFILSIRSRMNLIGVHPDLQAVVRRALEITPVDFMVGEGLRNRTRQAQLVASGASRTMNSRHLTGHAVDLFAVVGKMIRWDWPLYEKIAPAMKQAAKEKAVDLTWAGDWPGFRDGPHYELSWQQYPLTS